MKFAILLLVTILALGSVASDAIPIANEPAAQPADSKPPATATAATTQELKLPPGFRRMKRGRHVLYCKPETPLGTRLKSLKCLDEPQLRDYILALEQTKGDVDRIRAICSNPCACGQPDAC